ncbi:MAG TPA: extracellular solute-binding protein [Chloroflexota bacterium]|nr:extracellular solute-binding protein [Chloroflexota bacterium]
MLIAVLAGCGWDGRNASASATPPGAASKPAPVAPSGTSWETTLAAAKQEGKVVVAGPPGDLYRRALMEFQKQYPQISVEYSGLSGRDFSPKVLPERQAGQYLWDIHVGGPETPNFNLKPQSVLDPIKPALMLPEVLEESKWLGGFDDGFMDRERRFTYGFQGDLSQHVYVNRESVPESQLSSVEQLIDAAWKGKISWNDPMAPGSGSGVAGYWLMLKGEDWLRTLYQQNVTVTADLRQQIQWLVQNRYPIAIGGDSSSLLDYQRQGVGKQVVTLAPDSQLGSRLSPGFGSVMLINRAPHPNAAKAYLNWLLSRDGQTAWTSLSQRNSRRLDVQGPPETAPKAGATYIVVNKEENQPNIQKAIDIAKTMLK